MAAIAVVGYNSDPVVRSVAEDGTQAAVRAADEFYTVFGGDVLGGLTVVLAYNATTNDLTFYKLNSDLTTAAAVPMDPSDGAFAGGAFWGSIFLPICAGPTGSNVILLITSYSGGYAFNEYDASTGLETAHNASTTGTPHDEPDRPLLVLGKDGDKVWFNRRDISAGHEVVISWAYSPTTGWTGGPTVPSWSTDDLDTQIMTTFDPVDENTILHIRGLRELPSGNLLIGGSNGSVVEVDPATGTILNFIPPWHFAFEIDGLALDPDGVHFWLTTNSTPNALALSPPAGATGTDLCTWVIKMAFDGSVVDHFGAHPAGTPTDLWMGVSSSVVVRGVTDDAPAIDSVTRRVWRPSGELISNPVKLTIKPPVPITPPPSPEPVSPLPPPVFTPATMKKPRRETTIRPPGRRVRENTWASDVPVSRPTPPDRTVLKDMGGFGFTSGGLAHNINDEQVDEIFTPTFAPPPTRKED